MNITVSIIFCYSQALFLFKVEVKFKINVLFKNEYGKDMNERL